jgi:hypothetical protein
MEHRYLQKYQQNQQNKVKTTQLTNHLYTHHKREEQGIGGFISATTKKTQNPNPKTSNNFKKCQQKPQPLLIQTAYSQSQVVTAKNLFKTLIFFMVMSTK